MKTINHPITGRNYRRQISTGLLILFVFCRSILPTKQIYQPPVPTQKPAQSQAKILSKTQKSEREWTPNDTVNAAVFIGFLYVIYEFVDSCIPDAQTRHRNNQESIKRQEMEEEMFRRNQESKKEYYETH
jgi:hypothetical protein